MKQDEMREDYIRMAKEAGCFVTIGGNDYSLVGLMAIERFAQAVAAHERESCARECDTVAGLRTHPLEHKFRLSAQECATNIRARKGMTPNERLCLSQLRRKPMKIRDSFAVLNGDNTITEMPSGGLEIIGDDGRSLFALRLTKEGVLEVSGGDMCKHGGKLLEERISIEPRACNLIYVRKSEYEA